MDYFDVRFAAVDKYDQKQDQVPRHANELITLFAIRCDEVVLCRHMIRIAKDFPRCLKRDSVNPFFAGSHVNLISI